MPKLPLDVRKLPLDVQARRQSAEEKHSEVGGREAELPPYQRGVTK